MVAKCANPNCGVPFRYFRDGKLFRFDLRAPSTPARVEPDSTAHRRVEDFWLCGTCASKMTLISGDGVGVRTRPLAHPTASSTVSIEDFPINQAA